MRAGSPQRFQFHFDTPLMYICQKCNVIFTGFYCIMWNNSGIHAAPSHPSVLDATTTGSSSYQEFWIASEIHEAIWIYSLVWGTRWSELKRPAFSEFLFPETSLPSHYWLFFKPVQLYSRLHLVLPDTKSEHVRSGTYLARIHTECQINVFLCFMPSCLSVPGLFKFCKDTKAIFHPWEVQCL